jgi:glucosylglycerate hydrolase
VRTSWQSLHQLGCSARADAIRSDSLSQLVAAGQFGEYFEPFTGKQLGSTQQSWTAAVTLDWLASEHEGRPGWALTGQDRGRTMTPSPQSHHVSQ